MMSCGDKNIFAIEAEPESVELPWVLGRFRFWVGGREIGDWEDSAALNGCVNWLRAFSQEPLHCTEPSLAHSSSVEIFRQIVDPVFGPAGISDPRKQPIPFAYERFHITHLGMSSFDHFVVVLIKDESGAERCLWRKDDEEQIFDHWLGAFEMERVAGEFCKLFEAAYGKA